MQDWPWTEPGLRSRRLISDLRGFTLIELIVVLALAGAIMAITPPLISAALPGVELKAAARRTAAGLRLARVEAIRSGRDAALRFDVSERRFEVDGEYRRTQLSRRIEIRLEVAAAERKDDDVGTIRFFPDGSSTGGIVILHRGGDKGYQVGVNWLTGRIRMQPWEAW